MPMEQIKEMYPMQQAMQQPVVTIPTVSTIEKTAA